MKKEQEDQELKSEAVYLDSNLFITAAISLDSNGEKARELIDKINNGLFKAYTSALTIDEVIWIVQKFKDRETAYETAKTIISTSKINFIPIDIEIVSASLELYKETNLKPRDSIHLATMKINGISTIVSQDSDFDKIKDIKRIDFSK